MRREKNSLSSSHLPIAGSDRHRRRTGPDGALWVVDMYRLVIEHPEYIDDDVETTLDLRAGHNQGRIYRIYPEDKQPRSLPDLHRLDTPGLVAALGQPQRLAARPCAANANLCGDRNATAALTVMATNGGDARTRLHALCTLDGLGTLNAQVLLAALMDPHPAVRRHAVRLVGSPWLPVPRTS